MTSHEPKNPRVVLLDDHRRIDALLGDLLAAVHADDREAVEKSLAKVESALLAHLNVEEMFVFPALADAHAAEIDRLRREHATIRRELGEMGIAAELHALRAGTVEAFCNALKEHAEREDSLAYPQAERKLPANIARAIVDRIKAATTTRRREARAPMSRRSK